MASPRAQFLPYSTYIEHSRIKYDHGYQDMPDPFSWDAAKGGQICYDGPSPRGDANKDKPNLLQLNRCLYCSTDVEHFVQFESPGLEWRRGDAVQCPHCLWWVYCWSKNKFYPWEFIRNVYYEGAVCTFNCDSVDLPILALREAIRKQETDLRSLSPSALETIVGSVFSDYFNARVEHVGGPGDGGIDLLVEKERRIAVQVKRRQSPKPSESVEVVRNLIGSILLGDVPKGVVVSTAAEFSDPAKVAVESPQLLRHGIEVDVYNYQKLLDLVQATAPAKKPWLSLIRPIELGIGL